MQIPQLKNSKGQLKKELKYMTYSYCFMCDCKNFCNIDTKKEKHCMNYSIANDLKKIIDFYHECLKEEKKSKKSNTL